MRKKVFAFFMVLFIALCGLGVYCITTFTSSTSEKAIIKPKPINVLVMIKDRYSGLTDSMMLFNYVSDDCRINMLNIPRDTSVTFDGGTHKINSIYTMGGKGTEGARLACKYVSELTGAKITKYVVADLDIVQDVVNAVGGVDFRVPIRMKYRDRSQHLKINLKRGRRHLNGEQVEMLLRYRHPNTGAKKPKGYDKYYDGSDLKRTGMQMKFIKEFIRQKANVLSITKVSDVINSTFKNIETNVSKTEMLRLASTLPTLSNAQYNTFRLNGDGYSYYVYDGNIINTKTNKLFSGSKIIKEYFALTPKKIKNKKAATGETSVSS